MLTNNIFAKNELLFFVLFIFLCGVAYAETEEFEENFEVKSGGDLIIESSHGLIRVETWDKNEARVKATISARSKSRIEGFRLNIEKKNNKIIVEGSSSWGSNVEVKYNVSIPRRFNVALDTGGGSIFVGDLHGKIEADTSGGSIKVGDVDGDVDVNTSGGAISVGRVTGVVKVDTSGGSIYIESGGRTVDAETSGGSINIGPSHGNVNADTSGGSISVAHAKGSIAVDTSGGSIRIEGSDGNVVADTSGGSINVDNVAGTVDADTSGGGISITRSRGAINADTAGGNITAELVEDDPNVDTTINLDTAGGSITVYLPEKIQATVSAKLQLRRRNKDSQIYSDFPLTIKDHDNEVIAEGNINGGGDPITLRTVNGDIYIKRLK